MLRLFVKYEILSNLYIQDLTNIDHHMVEDVKLKDKHDLFQF